VLSGCKRGIWNIHLCFLALTLTVEGPTPFIFGISSFAPICRRRRTSNAGGLPLRLLLVGGANTGTTIRLVGGATAVGQAFRFSLLPAVGLLQDLWLLSWLAASAITAPGGDGASRFLLVDMRRRRNSTPTYGGSRVGKTIKGICSYWELQVELTYCQLMRQHNGDSWQAGPTSLAHNGEILTCGTAMGPKWEKSRQYLVCPHFVQNGPSEELPTQLFK
jgi:hypothetical protein